MTDQTPIQTTPATAAADEAPARLYGVVDVLRPNRIAGWAIDRSDSAAALTVDIFRDGRLHSSVVADRHRPDLEKGGIGTGRYGFVADIMPPLDPGFEFTVSAIARSSDGLTARLKPVGAAQHEVAPELRLMHRILTRLEDLKGGDGLPEAAREAIEGALARLEVTQARIEATLAAVQAPPPPSIDGRFMKLVFGTAFLSLVSLAVGIASFWVD